MSVVTLSTAFVVLMLLASVLLGWIADLRRVGGAVSARETHAQAEAGRTSFYTTREDRAEAMRERIRRERLRRERARAARAPAAGSPGGCPEAGPFRAGAPHADRPSAAPLDAPEAHHRAVLELGPGPVTLAKVRRHYLRLVVAYHPDRVAGLGVKLQRLAEEETKAINEAYAFFKGRLDPEVPAR